ncbi:hypothetical protein DVH24_038977 [Malus domestica]|uniref:Uncharacterized protein n=1 Tax=Malus domestica TaxID=3750 RepID=A0A498KGU1_MALDO|nr:hypothetical protein DVH24_038977 [Malus domestica]
MPLIFFNIYTKKYETLIKLLLPAAISKASSSSSPVPSLLFPTEWNLHLQVPVLRSAQYCICNQRSASVYLLPLPLLGSTAFKGDLYLDSLFQCLSFNFYVLKSINLTSLGFNGLDWITCFGFSCVGLGSVCVTLAFQMNWRSQVPAGKWGTGNLTLHYKNFEDYEGVGVDEL